MRMSGLKFGICRRLPSKSTTKFGYAIDTGCVEGMKERHDMKVVLFSVPGAYTPIYGYERSATQPNGHRNVFVADEDIRFLQNLETPVAERDEISIVPAIAGG